MDRVGVVEEKERVAAAALWRVTAGEDSWVRRHAAAVVVCADLLRLRFGGWMWLLPKARVEVRGSRNSSTTG